MTITTDQRYYLQIQVFVKVLAEIAAEVTGRTELDLDYSSGNL